jgi:hypothetical protein
MKISKIYFGEDEETLLVQFEAGDRLAECGSEVGMEWDPSARPPNFWTEVLLPSPKNPISARGAQVAAEWQAAKDENPFR